MNKSCLLILVLILALKIVRKIHQIAQKGGMFHPCVSYEIDPFFFLCVSYFWAEVLTAAVKYLLFLHYIRRLRIFIIRVILGSQFFHNLYHN
jgi:hypothetical protein